MNNFENKSIILFDGICNLCNSSVNFIIKNDSKEQFMFASLQSDAAKEILLQQNWEKNNINSILLVQDGNIFDKSTAALKIAKNLDGIYKLLYLFIIIPTFIRNILYDYIAKNRYKWYGKKDSCMIPTPELKKRFLGN